MALATGRPHPYADRASSGRRGRGAMTTDQFIEVFKAGVWPAIVVGLVYYFRREIKRAFPRMTKAGLSGLEFATEQAPSQPISQTRAHAVRGRGAIRHTCVRARKR
jgi:hypothetical protein